MSEVEFPQSWVKTEIGKIADVVAGGTPSAGNPENFELSGQGIAWLTPADLSKYKNTYISHGARDLSQIGYKSSSAKIIPKGSILFSSRAPIGYVAIASNEISTNQGFKNFVFGSSIHPEYAYYYLKSIRDLAESLGTGTTFREISGATAKTLPFIICPLAEQQQIAAKLDELLAQVDSLKTRLDAIPKILKRFRQSVLAAAVSGKLTEEWRGNTIKFQDVELKQIINSLDQGWSPKCLSEATDSNEWAVIKTSAIQHMHFLSIENKILPENLAPKAQLVLEKDDVLITRAGPRVRCGVTCIVDKDYPKLMICDKVYRIKLNKAKASPMFVNIALNSPEGLREIELLKTGSSDSGMNMTQGKINTFKIPLPPLEEQTEIVRRVEQLFTYADQIEQRVKDAQSRVNHLTQAILAKAFRGELTAEWREQNPDLISGENSAEALLARIQAEREVSGKVTKRSRKVV